MNNNLYYGVQWQQMNLVVSKAFGLHLYITLTFFPWEKGEAHLAVEDYSVLTNGSTYNTDTCHSFVNLKIVKVFVVHTLFPCFSWLADTSKFSNEC